MSKRAFGRRSRMRQLGFTLIELMVSLVIGFAVVGALVAAYMTSLRGSTSSDALVQIAEDATLALNVIRSQVAQAGFSDATGTAPGAGGGTTLQTHDFTRILGCANSNFGGNLNVGIKDGPACAGASTSDAIEVAYEGSVMAVGSNGILGGASGKEPLDCLGNSYLKIPDPGTSVPFYLNDSKFYVDNGTLYCHGPGNAAGAPLVEHVDAMKVSYGMAGDMTSKQVTYYQPAPAIGNTTAWQSIVSVNICIQVRSAQKVLDSTTQATLGAYIDCDNQPGTLADGYLHRSFSTTVVLQNKL